MLSSISKWNTFLKITRLCHASIFLGTIQWDFRWQRRFSLIAAIPKTACTFQYKEYNALPRWKARGNYSEQSTAIIKHGSKYPKVVLNGYLLKIASILITPAISFTENNTRFSVFFIMTPLTCFINILVIPVLFSMMK